MMVYLCASPSLVPAKSAHAVWTAYHFKGGWLMLLGRWGPESMRQRDRVREVSKLIISPQQERTEGASVSGS